MGNLRVYAFIDNNQEKWEQEIEGISIRSPEMLNQLYSVEYKILICIKNYLSVTKQLDSMEANEYSIFDPGKGYPRKRKPLVPRTKAAGFDGASAVKKKYLSFMRNMWKWYVPADMWMKWSKLL